MSPPPTSSLIAELESLTELSREMTRRALKHGAFLVWRAQARRVASVLLKSGKVEEVATSSGSGHGVHVMTDDGRTALGNGKSQWITGPEARKDGHRWRARACAIATGAGTVKADDPQLTVRDVETPRQPLRVLIDSHVETPPQARILKGEKVLIFAAVGGKTLPNAEIVALPNAGGKVDLTQMLEELARRGVNELHVEGGFKLNGSLVREGCVDEFLIYLNPSLLGDSALGMVNLAEMTSLDQRVALKIRSVDRIGEDLRIVARVD